MNRAERRLNERLELKTLEWNDVQNN